MDILILVVSWIVFGGIVGLIARAVFPGRQPMNAFATIGLGVVGSFVGGMLANFLFGGSLFVMHAAGWIGSILGALVVLAVLTAVSAASSRRGVMR